MDAEQFQRIAKALADPRRFEILEHIAKQAEVGCQRLCGCFPVRQATISHHLKELASAGLVESRKDGQYVYYRARPAVIEAYMGELRRRVDIRGDGTQPAPAPRTKAGAKTVGTKTVGTNTAGTKTASTRRKTAAAKRA